ncbi:MAG: hypothetical protein WKG01_40670 [Kofleriaceae bacterium]
MRMVLSLLAVAACSSDPAATPDAAPIAPCLVPSAYGALGTKAGSTNPGGPTTATIALELGPPRDSLFVKLVAGKGVFAAGLAIGTFSIAGADATFNDCGLCVNLIADIVGGSGPTAFYAADAGSVTLTATSPPAGTLTNLHFVEVSLSTGQPVTGGCTSTISSLQFSAS